MEALSRRPRRAMTEPKPIPKIVIRGLESIEDLRQIEPVEKEVWGLAERDFSPMTLLIAHKEAGSILIGAFDGDKLAGFAFGFPALDQGRLFVHSRMLAVLPEYRDLDLGYKLKLAQRDHALALGIKQMTWTFDSLQSRNAHFNFAKLGVVSDRYKVDFYGHDSSSVLHQNGTDRLWVTWPLASRRVQQRLQTGQEKIDLWPTCLDAKVLYAAFLFSLSQVILFCSAQSPRHLCPDPAQPLGAQAALLPDHVWNCVGSRLFTSSGRSGRGLPIGQSETICR